MPVSVAFSAADFVPALVKNPLAYAGLAQGGISVEVRLHPMMKTLGVEHRAMGRIIVAHPGKRFGEASLQRQVKIGT
jgi:hypothetical protein